jgi:N-acetylmuramoyl-L-alanine amidase
MIFLNKTFPIVARILKTSSLLAFILIFVSVENAAAVTTNSNNPFKGNRKLQYENGIQFLGGSECALGGSAGGVTSPSVKNVYMLGDSITVRSKNALDNAFKANGVLSTYIDASESRSITKPGTTDGFKTSGLDAVDSTESQAPLGNADAVVIALGTNQRDGSLPNFESKIHDLIQKVKEVKSRGTDEEAKKNYKIYWVNVFSEGKDPPIDRTGINKSIEKMSSSEGFTPIDTVGAHIEVDSSDNVHPTTTKGVQDFAKTVAAGIGSKLSAVAGGKPENVAWSFFMDPSKGLKDFQVAGILGNLKLESNIEPQRLQNTAPGVKTPAESLSPAQLADRNLGWGIAQFSGPGKIINPTKAAGKDPNDIQVQLDFIWEQLQGKGPAAEFPEILPQIKGTTSMLEAVKAWQGTLNVGGQYRGYERPGDEAVSVDDRLGYAKILFNKLHNTSVTGAAPATVVGSCSCPVSASPADAAGDGKTVVIDPGHGPTKTTTDSATSLVMAETDNQPEGADVWKVATDLQDKLTHDGYTVILAKPHENDNVTFRERANVANDKHAALAISIHTDGSQPYDSFKEVWPQTVGQFRQESASGGKKTTFSNAAVATKSQQYADSIKEERQKAEGDTVSLGHFNRQDVPSPGTISMVQLFADVPWVYNEIGSGPNNQGLTASQRTAYATGLYNGIKKALDSSGGTSTPAATGSTGSSGSGCKSEASTGTLSDTVKAYAWPDYHPAPYIERMPAWAEVADDPKTHYVGGTVNGVKGIDCGGFVTTTIRDSGIDAGYNPGKGGTGTSRSDAENASQWGYLAKNWKEIHVESTADLQPGDVAINSHHTFLYVGKIDGFNGVFASASYDPDLTLARAPMAGQGDPLSNEFVWYRKK